MGTQAPCRSGVLQDAEESSMSARSWSYSWICSSHTLASPRTSEYKKCERLELTLLGGKKLRDRADALGKIGRDTTKSKGLSQPSFQLALFIPPTSLPIWNSVVSSHHAPRNPRRKRHVRRWAAEHDAVAKRDLLSSGVDTDQDIRRIGRKSLASGVLVRGLMNELSRPSR